MRLSCATIGIFINLASPRCYTLSWSVLCTCPAPVTMLMEGRGAFKGPLGPYDCGFFSLLSSGVRELLSGLITVPAVDFGEHACMLGVCQHGVPPS